MRSLEAFGDRSLAKKEYLFFFGVQISVLQFWRWFGGFGNSVGPLQTSLISGLARP